MQPQGPCLPRTLPQTAFEQERPLHISVFSFPLDCRRLHSSRSGPCILLCVFRWTAADCTRAGAALDWQPSASKHRRSSCPADPPPATCAERVPPASADVAVALSESPSCKHRRSSCPAAPPPPHVLREFLPQAQTHAVTCHLMGISLGDVFLHGFKISGDEAAWPHLTSLQKRNCRKSHQ